MQFGKKFVFSCLALLLVSLAFPAIRIAGATPLQILSPGISGATIPSAPDYASEVLNRPWAMSSATDLPHYVDFADVSALTMSYADGMLTTTGTGFFYLLPAGLPNAQLEGMTGQVYPIDTARYRYLVMRMYYSNPSSMKILVNSGNYYYSDWWQSVPIYTSSGWNTYTIDLATIQRDPNLKSGSNPAWGSANATGLRIDPSVSGGSVKIDWAMLTGEPPVTKHSLVYSAPSGNKPYSLYLDDDSNPGNGYLKALLSNAQGAGTVNIDSSGLFPGSYRVVGVESFDFASLLLDPWDMGQATDVSAAVNMTASKTANGFEGGAHAGNYLFLNNHGQVVNTNTFRYLRLDLNVNKEGGVGINFFTPIGSVGQSTSIYATAGRNTYCVDLWGAAGTKGPMGGVQIAFWASEPYFVLHSVSMRSDACGTPEASPLVVTSPGTLKVNSAPALKITQPDAAGGEDFSSAVLGKPWNMNATNNIGGVYNQDSSAILPDNFIGGEQGNFYRGRSLVNNYDPYQLTLNEGLSSPTRVDASRYKNLSFKMFIDRPQDINEGSISRIVWHVSTEALDSYYNSIDIINYNGWNEYVLDMKNIRLEPRQHAPGTFPEPPWYGAINLLRVDSHEFSVPTYFYFDYVRLTADDEANNSFRIAFDASDADTVPEDVRVSFYYNTARSTSGGTLIGQMSLSDGRGLTWNTSSVPDNTYYVYGVIDDGHNQVSRLATGALVVNHQRAGDSTQPILSVSHPGNLADLYDTTVVDGYALDFLQLAGVDVLVDGFFLDTLKTGRFDRQAQNLYPLYTEAGNAGFRKTLDLSSILPGTHTMEFRAIDTAGNVTSSGIINFTKKAGADPSPVPEPVPYDGSPIEIQPVGPVSSPSLGTPKLSAKLSAQTKTLTLTVTNTAGCSAVQILGGSTSSRTKATLLKQKVAKSKVTFSATKLVGLKPSKKKAPVYFFAGCNNAQFSSGKSVSPVTISRGSIKTASAWLKALKKKLK